MLAEKIVVTIDKSFDFDIQDYDHNRFYDYMKSSLSHDTFILPKTASSLFDKKSTAKLLLCNKNIPLEDGHYKIKSLNPSDTIYAVNKVTKNVDAYYSGLTLNSFCRLGVNYKLYRYLVDSGHFLDDILLDTDSEGNKTIKPDLDCYGMPVIINDDAGIFLYNDHAIVIYHGIHINLYQILFNLVMCNLPSLYIPNQTEQEKQSFNDIGRMIYERLARDYE